MRTMRSSISISIATHPVATRNPVQEKQLEGHIPEVGGRGEGGKGRGRLIYSYQRPVTDDM